MTQTRTTEVRNAPQAGAGSTLTADLRKEVGDGFKLEVSFTAAPGITILFGASGAGKTTLLHCIAGAVTPESGRLEIGGRVLFDSRAGINVPTPRRRVGYVLQDLALFPHLTIEQNIRYGLANLPAAEQIRRCEAMLESFRITHTRRRKPRDVSGGEAQRVVLARTLVTDPIVLLLDEPLAALDAATKSKIMDDLRQWNLSHRVPVLYVTHSREEVFALGERVLMMDRGKIIADGSPHQVMAAPWQETDAQLAGFENVFDAAVTAVHEARGTMTCRLADSVVDLETPLVRAEVGSALRVGLRAGDVLLATSRPEGLSARNIISGKMVSLAQRDVIVVARVDCGVEMEVHLTLAARDALHLQPGQPVWLIVKTHSCHLMRG